jgi:rhodanese-related sulfurtransferase
VEDNIKGILPEELEELIENNKDQYVLIDVREDDEVQSGMIEGAKHIPLQEIPQASSELNKDKEYVLICRSGRRSMNACMYMKEQGFKVTNMTGGMLDWKGEVVF